MSFILEALKKSDKTRQVGTVPKLETVHESVVHSHVKRPKWPWMLLVLLNAVVLLWLFGPWQQQVPLTPAVATHPMQGENPDEAVKPQPAEKLASASLEERPPAPALLMPLAPPAPIQVAEQIKSLPLASPAEKAPENLELSAGQKRIYSLEKLPLAVRRDIPKIHMSVHSFSQDNPAANLIRINGQIMRPGASLTDKYLLEEITSEGAVFLFEGYRFLVPRKNSRE